MRRDLRTSATGAAGAAGVPAAYHEARLAYRQGRIADALLALDDLLEAPELLADPARRDAALLRAWCLIERKDPDAARAWLRTARDARLVPSGDVTARVIDLNARLYAEDHEAIAAEAEELLTTCVDPADLDHAELRLILGASLRWQGRLEDALGHVEFACSAFTVLDEPGRCAVAANFLGWTCLSLGRLTEARRWFEKSLGINTRLEAPARMAQNYQNLAIVCYKQGDYAAVGIPMMPNVAGVASTKRQILAYSVILVASTLAPQALGFAGTLYTAVALVTGASFILLAWRLFRTTSDAEMRRAGRRLFTYSLSYLFVIFLALLTDHWLTVWGAL